MRAVSTEFSRYVAATQSFRDKYFAIPGDFNKATQFWGKDTTLCNSEPGTAGVTCNGDGNGSIIHNTTNEYMRFWQHLALAGLIEGSYSGVEASAGNVYDSIPGTTVPRSKFSTGQWFARDFGERVGHQEMFDGSYGNAFSIGARNGVSFPYAPIFKPEEMWNIDTKMDDGKPATGNVRPGIRASGPCTVKADGSAMTTSAPDAALKDAQYALAVTTPGCAIYFLKAY